MTEIQPATDAERAERAMAALDQLTDQWATEIDLLRFVSGLLARPDKAQAVEDGCRQSFLEGAYRGFDGAKALYVARADAERARAEKAEREREELALAICGGEDAPGYANAQPNETLCKIAKENDDAWQYQFDRAEAAEAKLAKAREALCDAVACLGGFYSDRVPQSIRDAILANIEVTFHGPKKEG